MTPLSSNILHERNAVRELEIAAGVVRDADAAFPQQAPVGRVDVDAVRGHRWEAETAELGELLHGRHAVPLPGSR